MTLINENKFNVDDNVLDLVGDRIYLVNISEVYIQDNQIAYNLENNDYDGADEYRILYNEQQWEDDQIGNSLGEYERILIIYQDILKDYPLKTTLSKEQLSEIRKKIYFYLK